LDQKVRTWRIVEVLTVQPVTEWSGQVAFVREVRDESSGRTLWLSVGARPVWHFTRHGSLALEVGRDEVRPPSGPVRTLSKWTLALQLGKGPGFFARPQLRLFYTQARWNRAAQAAAPEASVLAASGPFGSRLQGATFGVQVESWW